MKKLTISSLVVLSLASSAAQATQCDTRPIKLKPESVALLAKTKKIICKLESGRFTATLVNTGRVEKIKNLDTELTIFDTKFVREGNVFTKSIKWAGETRMMPADTESDGHNSTGEIVELNLGGGSLDAFMNDPCLNDDPNANIDPMAVPKFMISIYKKQNAIGYQAEVLSSTLRFPERPIEGTCTLY